MYFFYININTIGKCLVFGLKNETKKNDTVFIGIVLVLFIDGIIQYTADSPFDVFRTGDDIGLGYLIRINRCH